MVKTRNLLVSGLIISVCVFALALLFFNTSIPTYTVKDLIEHPKPESLLEHKIQLIGIVGTSNTSGFLLYGIYIGLLSSNNVMCLLKSAMLYKQRKH